MLDMEFKKLSRCFLVLVCSALIFIMLLTKLQVGVDIITQNTPLRPRHNSLVPSGELVYEESSEFVSKGMKTIYQVDSASVRARFLGYYHEKDINFDDCEYSNCIVRVTSNPYDAYGADLVMLYQHYSTNTNKSFMEAVQQVHERAEQDGLPTVWMINGNEPPSIGLHHWKDFINTFDGAVSYGRNNLVYRPYGRVIPPTNHTHRGRPINYAANKTKGAFAYVSDCKNRGYERVELMKKLGQFIDVDVFGGCTKVIPCKKKRGSYLGCIQDLHSDYHFYLAWENSLCQDYITEKFWKVLKGDGYYIPVALGGLSTEEYNAVAPPNSFLHFYNFSSIEQLGKYMKTLIQDHSAFNRYHDWRSLYDIDLGPSSSCKFCEMANFPTKYKRRNSNIAKKYNDRRVNCRKL